MLEFINGEGFRLVSGSAVRDHAALRTSFFTLARQVFGLDFAPWYQTGGWTDAYCPYALVKDDAVVANVSVNLMDFTLCGEPRRYVQLGTVMTTPAYREKGLSRRLIQCVLDDWAGRCGAVYLYANDSVLGFYPKFGFSAQRETQYRLKLDAAAPYSARRLDVCSPEGRARLCKAARRGNPFSALTLDNPGLVLFYAGLMPQQYLYLPQADAIVIAHMDGGTLLCYDIYGGQGHRLPELLASAAPGCTSALLGFTPADTAGCTTGALPHADDTLFSHGGKPLFGGRDMMFPLLSHA